MQKILPLSFGMELEIFLESITCRPTLHVLLIPLGSANTGSTGLGTLYKTILSYPNFYGLAYKSGKVSQNNQQPREKFLLHHGSEFICFLCTYCNTKEEQAKSIEYFVHFHRRIESCRLTHGWSPRVKTL